MAIPPETKHKERIKLMTRLYQNTWAQNPKHAAQKLLSGRTHYVDDDTLRFHHSRVLDYGIAQEGTLAWIITSDALDMHNTRRGFHYVIFDVFGSIVSRCNLENTFKSKKSAWQAMNRSLVHLDGKKLTLEGLERQKKTAAYEEKFLLEQLAKLEGESA